MTSMLVSASTSIRFAPLILLSAAMAAPSATYFVATDGQAEQDGSRAKPWPSVEHALSKVGGGHTILVKPGGEELTVRGNIVRHNANFGLHLYPSIRNSRWP